MTDTYVTVAELEHALPVSDNDDAPLLTLAIEGASRAIDDHCGQRFWQDTAVKTREFWSTSAQTCRVDTGRSTGISTTTGLVVKTDSAGDGTFATTLTINTDFVLLPVNAADDTPAEPYTKIWLPSASFPLSWNGRPNVQVTARFGWPAVPANVKAAAMLLARDLHKEMKDAAFGVAGIAEFGVLRIRQNPTALRLLARYVRPLVA